MKYWISLFSMPHISNKLLQFNFQSAISLRYESFHICTILYFQTVLFFFCVCVFCCFSFRIWLILSNGCFWNDLNAMFLECFWVTFGAYYLDSTKPWFAHQTNLFFNSKFLIFLVHDYRNTESNINNLISNGEKFYLILELSFEGL